MGISYPTPTQACYGQINQAKYDALLAQMKTDKRVSALTANSCTVAPGVDFTWEYNPTAEEITLTIVKVHSLKAKIAGNQAIFGVLYDQFIS